MIVALRGRGWGMAAGGSASRRAQEARRQERLLRDQWQAAREQARRWEAASEGEQQVSAQLLMLTERGWRLLVDRRWPGTRSANVDMLLVGPGGVFVVDVKNWRADPEVIPPSQAPPCLRSCPSPQCRGQAERRHAGPRSKRHRFDHGPHRVPADRARGCSRGACSGGQHQAVASVFDLRPQVADVGLRHVHAGRYLFGDLDTQGAELT